MPSSAFNPIAGEQRVLVVSEDDTYRSRLQSILEMHGFRVDPVAAIDDVRRRLVVLRPDLVLADLDPLLGTEGQDAGRQLLKWTRSSGAETPLLVLADSERFEAALEWLRNGAADFLVKPFPADELLRRVSVALMTHRQPSAGRAETAGGSTDLADSHARRLPQPDAAPGAFPADLILGNSPAIRSVIEQVELVAPKGTSVLITGETGSGKERIARALHARSRRYHREMVSVNCGGIPANLLEDEFFGHEKGAFTDAHQRRLGRFEQAHRGTIFLDEIGDLPLELQPKLLRVLQEREVHRIGGSDTVRVDARVIAATNVDLWGRVAAGSFREDLFYRINVFPIHLPPLRERREDITLFANHFLERFCRRDHLARKHLDAAAEAELMARPWPGNIRELENAMEIAVIRARERRCIELGDLPEARPRSSIPSGIPRAELSPTVDLKEMVHRFELDLIRQVLERTSGNKTHAADLLGVKRTTLIEKLKKLEVPVEEGDDSEG